MGNIDNLAGAVADAMPAVMAAVPPAPAAELGRVALATAPRAWPPERGQQPPVLRALGALPSWLVERVHGALELTVQSLPVDPVSGVTAALAPPPSGSFGFLSSNLESEAVRATRSLTMTRPGAVELVAALVVELAAHELVVPLLEVAGGGDEAAVAAMHGGAYLALAVVTATIVLREAGRAGAPAIVGTALGAVAEVLRSRPMPAVYADALLAKRRAEYLLPLHASVSPHVVSHHFAVTDGPFPESGDFAVNGLVEVVEGAVVIRTGVDTGQVHVALRVLAEPPGEVDTVGWEEVVEVSWHAARGSALVLGPGQGAADRAPSTPPWPGDYRIRVHARNRDEEDGERYELVMWSAPPAPPVVHARADRLGHRLRGEPEPPVVQRPEREYRWVKRSGLSVAATVTIVTGMPLDEVLRGFGADPADPAPLRPLREAHGADPWVAALDIGGAVLVIEENGFQGSRQETLCPISRYGKASSMFWNVNALTRLSFARGGEILMAGELGTQEPPDNKDILTALAGLDLHDYHDRSAKGLVAVARFTGHRVTHEHLDRIDHAAVGYLI